MAPRTPARPVSGPKSASKSAPKNTKAKASRKAPAAVAAPVASSATGATCCGGCSSSSPARASWCACLCSLLRSCPVGKHLATRSYWASTVVAFLVIFATDWLVNNRLLMADYIATSAFWRAEGDIRTGLLVFTQAVTALAYAVIILGMGHAVRWWGAMISGITASVPVAMVSVNTYAMMPFAESDIPAAWALTALAQGALVGLAICAALKASRAPETHDCSYGASCSCGKA